LLIVKELEWDDVLKLRMVSDSRYYQKDLILNCFKDLQGAPRAQSFEGCVDRALSQICPVLDAHPFHTPKELVSVLLRNLRNHGLEISG
jgi:hypothetical protein